MVFVEHFGANHVKLQLQNDGTFRAGLSIVSVVPWEGPLPAGGPRSPAKFLTRCFDVWTFSVGLNVTTTTKKGRQLLGGKSAPPEKMLAYIRVRENAPRLTLVWGPRMVNPALGTLNFVQFFLDQSVFTVLCIMSSMNVAQTTFYNII